MEVSRSLDLWVPWNPTFVGMTKGGVGMTKGGAGMTEGVSEFGSLS